MTSDLLYFVLRGVLDVSVWGGELIGDVEAPRAGPAVFVSNHAGAVGPIGVAASLPARLHPWVVGDMVDERRAAAWLCRDFVRGELRLPDPVAAPVSAALSRVTVPLLRSLGCIPVWHDRGMIETYRISDELLAAGRCLLIFPEDPDLPVDARTGLRPFMTGFAHLGSLHHARTRRGLQFYPVAVQRRRRTVQVAEPITYNALNADAVERRRIAHTIEKIIAAMLAEGTEDSQYLLREAS